MFGQFELAKYDCRMINPQVLRKAVRDRTAEALLKEQALLTGRYKARNRIFDNYAGAAFYWVFQSAQPTYPYYLTEDEGPSFLSRICLLSTDGETSSYTEHLDDGNKQLHNVTDSVNTSSAGKRFINDKYEAYSITSQPNVDGREEIVFSTKWLYTPGQSTSTNIRSLGIYYCREGASTSGENVGRIGRVRIKDQNGDTVIIHKNAYEALFVSYTFRLVSA